MIIDLIYGENFNKNVWILLNNGEFCPNIKENLIFVNWGN